MAGAAVYAGMWLCMPFLLVGLNDDEDENESDE